MKYKSYHVVPDEKGWNVKKGGGKTLKHFSNKSDAKVFGKNVSVNQKAELFIHGKDGKIQNRNSFGNDPCPPRDKKH